MNDDIELGKLSDREILILLASNSKSVGRKLENHGTRILRIERIMLIGSGMLLAVKAGVEWFSIRIKS